MMIRSAMKGGSRPGRFALPLLGATLLWTGAAGICAAGAAGDALDFDHQGAKLFSAYRAVTEPYLAADSGGRTLADYYALRQYPGSPPRIPHKIESGFGGESDCLACHARGGYSQEFGAFIPVTPHPENTLCYQCHVSVNTEERFVASDWQSIRPPRLGGSLLGSSPPPVPHSLQLRENCIACHTGPGAVAEIRVAHAARGDCRQCHVPAVRTAPMLEFDRTAPLPTGGLP